MRPAHLDAPDQFGTATPKKLRGIRRRKHAARTNRQNYERSRNIMRNNLRKGHTLIMAAGAKEPSLRVGVKGIGPQSFDSMIKGYPVYLPKSRKFATIEK